VERRKGAMTRGVTHKDFLGKGKKNEEKKTKHFKKTQEKKKGRAGASMKEGEPEGDGRGGEEI